MAFWRFMGGLVFSGLVQAVLLGKAKDWIVVCISEVTVWHT
jgi:hypothetical protein